MENRIMAIGIKQNQSNTIIHEDFLLQNEQAKILYHGYAKEMPIIDYHNHLPPAEIASNKKFDNLSQIWLKGDHYKWRAMRGLGVDEKFIIWALFIDPEFEKKGIGQKLHKIMMGWYFSQTKETVWLGTDINTRAEKFYRKAGWTEVGLIGTNVVKFEMICEDWINFRNL